MNFSTRIGIVLVLTAVIAAIVAVKRHETMHEFVHHPDVSQTSSIPDPVQSLDPSLLPGNPSPLPRMVDLGADNCIPCKLMAPILQELKAEYAHVFATHFIDVWENPAAGRQFGIRLIPTQIFFDAGGRELFRHEGFMSKQDILMRWKQLGVDVAGGDT